MPKQFREHAPKTRILVFGTFDGLHPGHVNFFRQAKALANNPELVVSVARDANVKKIKGRLPKQAEKVRLKFVKKNSLVDLAVLGALRNYLSHIVQVKPDIIALGYDQKKYTDGLKEKLSNLGLKVKIIRLKAYKPERFKSSIIKKASVDS